MAAHMGTGVQLASKGPQDAFLVSTLGDDGPGGTMFRDPFVPCSDFAEETRATLPLRSFSFGRTNVFPLPHQGDMLGDVCLEVRVPAIQAPVGTDLPMFTPPDLESAASSPATAVQDGTVFLDRLVAQPVTGIMFVGDGWTAYRFEWPDGLAWTWVAYTSGRAESTLTSTELPGHLVQPCRVTIDVDDVVRATFVQRVGRSAALEFPSGGTAVTENDVWHGRVALTLMRRARFVVGDLVVHDHERMWYDILDRLRVPEGVRAGMDAMLGRGASLGVAHILYLPFKFLSCRDGREAQTFFPHLLASKAAMRVELDTDSLAVLTPAAPVLPLMSGDWSATLLSRHYTLTSAERSALISRPPRLMYESAQDMDGTNYTGAEDVQPRRDVTVDLSEVSWPVTFLAWVAYDPTAPLFTYIPAPLESAALFLDGGMERQSGPGAFFEVMQPWYRAPRSPAARDVGMYSFALDSAARAPNGVATALASVRYPTLRVILTHEATWERTVHIKVWASTLNWLTFEGGAVSPAFSA